MDALNFDLALGASIRAAVYTEMADQHVPPGAPDRAHALQTACYWAREYWIIQADRAWQALTREGAGA